MSPNDASSVSRRLVRAVGPWLLLGSLETCAARPQAIASAPACGAVAVHIGDVQRSADAALEPGSVERLEANCRRHAWSATARRCIQSSHTERDIALCERAERIARGDDLGGPSCDVVVTHSAALLHAVGVPADEGGSPGDRERQMYFCLTRSRTYKDCVLAATTIADYGACSRAESPQ